MREQEAGPSCDCEHLVSASIRISECITERQLHVFLRGWIMGFSERMGKSNSREGLQIESMDEALRTGLWNVIFHVLGRVQSPRTRGDDDSVDCLHKEIWSEFFKHPAHEMPRTRSEFVEVVAKWFSDAEWHRVYSLIEFIAQVGGTVYDKYGEVHLQISVLGQERLGGPIDVTAFEREINTVLAREQSGYKSIGDQIAPVADELEVKAIGEALDTTEGHGLTGVHEHLQSALGKLSDRRSPDYRNSVKESISAVESICKIICGCSHAELPRAIAALRKKGIVLHPALKAGIISIYGWTSDADGIRHGMIDQSSCGFDEAKYMCVSCSAFVNYLIGKAATAGLLKV
ncbi:MAG: hypothetical protein JW955_14340 [Sedimentisphaerales bacterium]|nr:hypothetical protein [Sedimentisphaerales bacterium]